MDFLQQFFAVQVESEPQASPEQVGFQKAYGGISQICGVKTWPNSDWPLSGSALTFCTDQQRCNKLFRLCGRGLLKRNPLPPQPSAGRGRERAGKREGEEKKAGGRVGGWERRAQRRTRKRERKEAFASRRIVLSALLRILLCQSCLCWDLGCFVLSAVWSLSSLMSLNSRGRSNLSQDSAFCWVALTDVRDVLMSDDTVGCVSCRFCWMLDGLDFNQELVLECLFSEGAPQIWNIICASCILFCVRMYIWSKYSLYFLRAVGLHLLMYCFCNSIWLNDMSFFRPLQNSDVQCYSNMICECYCKKKNFFLVNLLSFLILQFLTNLKKTVKNVTC